MRKALVTLFGSGLAVSLVMSSCVVKDNSENDATGGTLISLGGSVISTYGGSPSSAAGGTGNVGPAECPDLIAQFQTDPTQVCSQSKQAAQFTQINMLIVLDKSGSMSTTPVGYAKSKWAGAGDALKTALKPGDTLVSYGMVLYPYPAAVAADACELAAGAAAVNIPVGPAAVTVPEINALVASTSPSGGTPTAAALGAALDYYTRGEGVNVTGVKYVLLVTDGGPNCNANVVCQQATCTAFMDRSSSLASCWNGGVDNCCDRASGSIGGVDPQALCLDNLAVTSQLDALRSAGINTFVIGIPGSEVYADYLNGFADAGGEAVTPVAPKTARYYEVTNEGGLVAALTAITTALVKDCTVPLVDPPQDKNKINVAVDCATLPQKSGDQVNWSYDTASQSIVIEGPKCAQIETAGVERIDVINGCNTVIIQ